ncbi:hypothetical protein PIB30_059947 [Stylosanthes scabra]|uniref:Uncharacterized protein n=1 Tax=Stylosanthes scabra TaxID=79078 RepID=A0ABU6QJV3_9FABA|nr:hypothetical protein [Stylosanthes scabra]
MGEFKDGEKIQIARPITAKVMTTTRGRIINQPKSQPMEEDKDNYDAENLYANHDQDQEMHFEAAEAEEDHHQQEQFFENMQKAQSQYLEELKSLRTKQDEMVNQQNNFYRQIKREQEKTIK